MTKEFVNLIKLCVGAQNVSDLYEWQKNRLIHDKSLENHATFFITRMRPKREKLMTAYDPKQKKNVFATQSQIEKQGLEPATTGSEMTADQRNFAAYKNIMQTGSAEEKELAKQIFVKGGRDIKSLEEFLLGVTSNLSQDVGVTPEDIQESLPQYEALYNRIIGQVESTTGSQKIEAPKNFKGTSEQWSNLKSANPDATDEQLIEFFNKKYGR